MERKRKNTGGNTGEKPDRSRGAGKNRLLKLARLLNPKNLEKEVYAYGYHFYWKTHIAVMLCTLLGITAIGILFQLKAVYMLVILAAVVVLFPVLVLDVYKRMYQQKRFADVTVYMEQMLYSFQKSRKVLMALRETGETFEDGQMKEVIGQAASYLEKGENETEKGTLREALKLIEEAYECSKIHIVHDLLANVEEYGGDVDDMILLVLEDLERWKRRGYKLQNDKKTSHTDNIVSIVVATILCAVALYVLDAMRTLFPSAEAFYIFSAGVIQISSALFILFMLYVFVKSFGGLTKNWLREDSIKSMSYVSGSYDTVMDYDGQKEKRKSILFSIPFMAGAAVAFIFSHIWIGCGCLCIAVFMMVQHRIGYNIAMKDVTDGLYMVFPEWLTQMVLLLQYNNVQVSIEKSIPDAPEILVPELEKLMERLEKEPDSLAAYTGFCGKFDMPEAQSCMKMLHAMSESGTGDVKVQMANLMQRVQEMQEKADVIRNEQSAFRMKLIFSYPVMAATVKLLVDMTYGMLCMFTMLGSMGGM